MDAHSNERDDEGHPGGSATARGSQGRSRRAPGPSKGDFKEALPALLGEEASGLSPTTIARLTNEWSKDHEAFKTRRLSDQRCWVHKIANVLDKLPKRLHAKAKAALHEIMRAETRKAAEAGIERFSRDYRAKYPKAVASLRRDEAELLAFFNFPAEHWLHLRTGNVIESPFATVRLRQRVTKGAGSRRKGLLMAFELLAMAERRWRRINAAHLVPLLRAGVPFRDGVQGKERDAA